MGNCIEFIRQKINDLIKPKQTSQTTEQPEKVRIPTTTTTTTRAEAPVVEKKRNVNALLIVDVQYDFIDGTLALKNCPSQHQGEQVIPILNKLINDIHFDVIIYTKDWHTHDHISFYDNLHLRAHLLAKDSKPASELKLFDTAIFSFDHDPKLARVEQILWPVHCVQQTHGAEIHHDLVIQPRSKSCYVDTLLKGDNSEIDSYSAFWDNQKIRETSLNETLRDHDVTQVFIGGIATDVCVYSTALHSVEYGYKTYIIQDACRGVDENNICLRLKDLLDKKCVAIQAANIKDLV